MKEGAGEKRTPSWAIFLIGIIIIVYTPYGFIFLLTLSYPNLAFLYYPLSLLLSAIVVGQSDIARLEIALVPVAISLMLVFVLYRRDRKSVAKHTSYAKYLLAFTLMNAFPIIMLLLISSTCHQITNPYNGFCYHY